MNFRLIKTAASIAVLIGAFVTPATYAASHTNNTSKLNSNMISVTHEASPEVLKQGHELALNRKKGNCFGCHRITGKDQEGNTGPALVAMKARYPDKNALRAQIYDATVRNPNTLMPPFGRHNILTKQQIDLITEYIYTL